jgi:ribosomal protein S18 acetylase RimI-like enzyme
VFTSATDGGSEPFAESTHPVCQTGPMAARDPVEIQLRQAGSQERDWLFALHAAAFRDYVEQRYGYWDDVEQRVLFDRRDPRNTIEIISSGGIDVGACHWRLEDDHVYIELLEVHPDHQNRGIGTAVLSKQLARSDWPATIRLSTRQGNPARHLYERLGFRVDQEEPDRVHLVLHRRDG